MGLMDNQMNYTINVDANSISSNTLGNYEL